MEPFNEYINLFHQAGLCAKWLKDTMDFFRNEAANQNRMFIQPTRVQLTFSHLEIAFFILGFGFGFSFLVLLLEIYSDKYSLKDFKIKKELH